MTFKHQQKCTGNSGSKPTQRHLEVGLARRLRRCNLISDGLRVFEYDAQNRHSKTIARDPDEGSKITYLHNALGQRVFKSEPKVDHVAPNATALGTPFIDWLVINFGWMFAQAQLDATLGQAYVYDDGQLGSTPMLLGEYGNGSSQTLGRSEYLWLPQDDGTTMPIGLYTNSRLYATHADHLNTPRQITDDANKVAWQLPYSAFGDNKPTGVLAQTAGLRLKATVPAVTFNLRFPGQYFDEESNLAYNYFRSYQSTQGRYTQADPIGLGGGANRFGYADGSPLTKTDPLGLATYMCTQPLHALGAAGRLLYSPGSNPLYHQFIGVIRPDGSVITGGQDRAGGPFSPGKPSEGDGTTSSGAECKKVEDDNQCIEQCLIGQFAASRPKYSLVLQSLTNGQNCQGYAKNTLAQCQASCKAKK